MAINLPPRVKGLILLAYLVIIALLTIASGGGDLQSMDLNNPSTVMLLKVSQALSVVLLFILPVILFVLFSSDKKLSYLRLNRFSFLSGMAVVALVFALMPLINWMGEMNGHLSLPAFLSGLENWMKESEKNLKEVTDIFLKMDGPGDLVLNVIVIALFAAVGEELLFRGAVQNVLVEWSGKKHLSVWITAILFSALHAQFYGFLPRMLLGVVLGYLYIWSGSLWLSMLFHFLNNGLAVLFAYLISKGSIPASAETVGAGDTSILLVLTSAIASIGLMLYIYTQKKYSLNEEHLNI